MMNKHEPLVEVPLDVPPSGEDAHTFVLHINRLEHALKECEKSRLRWRGAAGLALGLACGIALASLIFCL